MVEITEETGRGMDDDEYISKSVISLKKEGNIVGRFN